MARKEKDFDTINDGPDQRQGQKFFTAVRAVGGDGGAWMRRQAMMLSVNCCTPVGYWLSLPLRQFAAWIETNNEITREKGSENE